MVMAHLLSQGLQLGSYCTVGHSACLAKSKIVAHRCQGNMGTPSFGDPGSPYFLKNRDPGSLFLLQI